MIHFHHAGLLVKLWPHLSLDLQKRLLGVYMRHGKLSVKKVVAALRGASPALARTVACISQHSEVPDKSHSSAPALESDAVMVPSSNTHFNCSRYILHTCRVLLEKYAALPPNTTCTVSCEEFFLTLVDAGPSPLLLQWQEDGITSTEIQTLFKQCKAEENSALPSPPPSIAHATTVRLTHSTSGYKQRLCRDIFISYSREPAATSLVDRLTQDLKEAGYSVWVDTVDIPSGSDWHSAIGEALQSCRALVAIISKKYLLSKFCKNELFMADSSHKPIFPVFLEEVDLTSTSNAGVLYTISGINWVHAHGQHSEAVKKLVEGMVNAGIGPTKAPSKHLKQFSVTEVCEFISQLEIQPDIFRQNSVSGEELLELSDADLQKELGLRPLQIRKLRKHLKLKLDAELFASTGCN